MTAAGPQVPPPLLVQLTVGGRLVIPVGADPERQRLVRVDRLSPLDYERRDLGAVSFVPLVGAEGWGADELA